MHRARLLLFISSGVLGALLRADDAVATNLVSDTGAAVTFTADENGWRWSGLQPGNATPARALAESDALYQIDGRDVVVSPRWTLASQEPGRLVFEQELPEAGVRFRRVFSFGPAANVLRVTTGVQSLEGTHIIQRAGLMDLHVDGESFRETGAAPASFPAFSSSLFVGLEHVSGLCAAQDNSVHLAQTPTLTVGSDWQPLAPVIVGWPLESACSIIVGDARVREAFFQYLDSIRIRPADLELHTNTWWTLPLPFAEKDVLKDIEALRQGFTTRTGMFFDSFALDLGWSDNRSIWKVNAKNFPDEFRTINTRLRELGSRLGIWVSPGSAYPPGLDNHWLESSGYEVTPFGDVKVACFALGGRYQREFRDNLLRLVRDYGIRHVKLDFMAHTCDIASHGHPTGLASFPAIDAGLADVLDSLRAENPNIVLEPLCTGYPPSPWWATKTPYVLGPYGDDVPYGRVPALDWMESLISARDIAYRVDRDRWLMPSQAIETIDVVVQSPGNFENLAVMAIGRGRWFISTYLKPELMTPHNWDFLAALVRWARANKSYLTNALMIGGSPEQREAYGYFFHNPTKDLACLRNPWVEPRRIQWPACAEVTEPRELRMIFPRRETLAQLVPGGEGPWIELAPYETVMLETVPASGNAPVQAATPVASVENASASASAFSSAENEPPNAVQFSWAGTIDVPADLYAPELSLLIEGAPGVQGATCNVVLSGQSSRPKPNGSAGQFGAAASPSPENWTWFTVPLNRGRNAVVVESTVPLENATVSLYLRGATAAGNAPAPEDEAVFPVSATDVRSWSQTLVPRTLLDVAELGTAP